MTKIPGLKIRPWEEADIPHLVECQQLAYADYPAEQLYGARVLRFQQASFPEGQFLAEIGGRIVGYANSILLQLGDESYTYDEISGAGTFTTHDPAGDTLYGADIAVIPEFRGRGIAGELYRHRKRLLKRYNLRRMVAHGRLPGYRKVAGKMTVEEYVKAVLRGRVKDSALCAHLKAGYKVVKIQVGYMLDASSLQYSTLLEMENPEFSPEKRRIAAPPTHRPVRRVRVCAGQYKMRKISTWEEFEENVQFFISTADQYHGHFLLLPEFFTAQLTSLMPAKLTEKQAVRRLAGMHERYVELMSRGAKEHNLYIIAGSHPTLRKGRLYNVAHLFTPGGKVYTQDKLHITPSEREDWGIHPGEKIRIFKTPLASIAIQVCYDIEFPEVVRLLARTGVEIVFVPFHTDERKSYFRVRYCAHARAVENYVYVVIAGNVGNLLQTNYLLNYARSAVLTPSDFAFPMHAIAGEADPNVETVVTCDLDLDTLAQQRELGSVRPYFDLRPDLYDLKPAQPIEVVQVD